MNLFNPDYKILMLDVGELNQIILKPISQSVWIIDKGFIGFGDRFLCIKDNWLILCTDKQLWDISNNCLYNIQFKKYLSVNHNYELVMTSDVRERAYIEICGKTICYPKPQFRIKFDTVNSKSNTLNLNLLTSKPLRVGIILAGGHSSRFGLDVIKQLYIVGELPVILYSVEAMKFLDKIIIISNSRCCEQIKKLVEGYINIVVLTNDIDCRLESLWCGLKYIEQNIKDVGRVVVHDAARYLIKSNHIECLLTYENISYVQYILKLTNGLFCINNPTYDEPNRDDYVELVTPICINFNLAYYIFSHYMMPDNRISYEFLNIIRLMGLTYKLVEGHYNFLKKITTFADISNNII